MSLDKHTISVLDGSNNAFPDLEIIGKKLAFAHNSGPGVITGVPITQGGSYETLPTLSVSGNGSGATIQTRVRSISATLVNAGTGYTVNEILILAGVTGSSPVAFTVNSVGGSGEILTFTRSNPGDLITVIPANPAGVTGGTGTGATFNMLWEIQTPIVVAGGSGYDSGSVLVVTGGGSTGGGAGTLIINNTGNTATIPVTFPSGLPDDYGVFVNPAQNCRWYVPQNSKTNNGFNIVLVPATTALNIAAGNLDLLVVA